MSSFLKNFTMAEAKTKEQEDVARERGGTGLVTIYGSLKTSLI